MAEKIDRTRWMFVGLAFLNASLLLAQGPPPGRGPDPKIKISPDTVYFTLSGDNSSQSHTVNVNRTGPPGEPLTATVKVTAVTGGNWLVAGSVANEKLTLTATRGNLAPGQYESTVTVTPTGASALIVKAYLRVVAGGPGEQGEGAKGGLLVRPARLAFKMNAGAANPEPRYLNVTSTAGWTASATVTSPAGGSWLRIAANTAGGVIAVTPNGTGLATGSYEGLVSVTAGTQLVQVPVTLDVNTTGQGQGQGEDSRLVVIHPRAFNFIQHAGGPLPGSKALDIKTTRAEQIAWTAVSTANWLKVTPSGQTPGTAQLTLVAANLPASGHHEATVKVTAGGVTETARVFFRIVGAQSGGLVVIPGGSLPLPPVTTPSAVTISPGSLDFSATAGVVSPASAAVQVTSPVPGLSFTAARTTADGGPWLQLSTTGGGVPGGFSVSVNPAGLLPGLYRGLVTVTISGAANEQRQIGVTLRVSAAGAGPSDNPRLTVSKGGVTFQSTRNNPAPAAEQITLDARNAASIPFQAVAAVANDLKWLTVSPSTGTAPAVITLAANPAGLTDGVYTATVFFQATGQVAAFSAAVNVVLTVTNSATPGGQSAPGGIHGLFVSPAPDFVGAAGQPMAVTLSLFRADGAALTGARVVLASSGDEDALELPEVSRGTYSTELVPLSAGPMSITASASVGSEVFQIGTGGDVEGAAEALPVVFRDGVVSTANFASGVTPGAPGAIMSVFGRDLLDRSATAGGFPLPRTLGGSRVLVAGIEAPLISASVDAGQGFDQLNFQLPAEAGGLTYADVVVQRGGLFSNSAGLSVAPTLPAIFSQNGAGNGLAAALHPDFTLVTAARPAAPGSTVILYATGLGETTPALQSGQPPASLSRVAANVEITVGGVPAKVTFAGMAPSFAGLYQVNFEVPAGVTPGEAALKLFVSGISSGESVTLAVGR